MENEFEIGDWVITKSFQAWYDVLANREDFNPKSAQAWYDLEWPKNVVRIIEIRKDESGSFSGISPFLYFDEPEANTRTGYSYLCFKKLEGDEKYLTELLFGEN